MSLRPNSYKQIEWTYWNHHQLRDIPFDGEANPVFDKLLNSKG